jgi:hypothetical protein
MYNWLEEVIFFLCPAIGEPLEYLIMGMVVFTQKLDY